MIRIGIGARRHQYGRRRDERHERYRRCEVGDDPRSGVLLPIFIILSILGLLTWSPFWYALAPFGVI